jgi:hypothetical protein
MVLRLLIISFGAFFLMRPVDACPDGICDREKSAWRKMKDHCDADKVRSKVAFINCLSNIPATKISDLSKAAAIKKVEEGYIEIDTHHFLTEPTPKSIHVFRFDRWACDVDGALYLLRILG